MANLLYKDLSYAVVGCAQRVHSILGMGFPESVYQKALCHELTKAEIPFSVETALDVTYDGVVCGKFRVDILVDNKIILELKAVKRFNGSMEAQIINYLKISGIM